MLDVFRCPASRAPLQWLSRTQLEALNRAIAGGGVQSTAGAPVDKPLSQGLITVDGKLVYRIEDDIPVMLAEEAIGTTQFNDFPHCTSPH